MRLFPISDLHLERRDLADIPPPRGEFDVLVCAGDLWEGDPAEGMRAVAHLSGGRPALIVPGNHDHYRSGPVDPRAWPEMLAALEEEAARYGIAVLRSGAAVEIRGVRFVGATLWSDWSLAGYWAGPEGADAALARAQAHVLDPARGSREYRGAILSPEGGFWSPEDARGAHARDRAMLAEALARPFGGPVVAITHHPPLVEILAPYRSAPGVPEWLPGSYGSRVLADLPAAHQPDAWISGHFHAGHDLKVGRTRCVANPVAGRTFDPGLVVEIGSA